MYRLHMSRQELAAAVKDAALLTGDFLLASGKRSPYYLDKFLIGTDPELLYVVGAHLGRLVACDISEWSALNQGMVLRIAAPELGAIPLATSASQAIGMRTLLVRKAAKDRGTGKRIEGKFIPQQTTATVIEDVVTSGGEVIKAIEALREAGVHVWKVVCLLDREQGGRAAIEAMGVKFMSLLTWADLGLPAHQPEAPSDFKAESVDKNYG